MPTPFCPHKRLWTTCDICRKEFEDKERLAALSEGRFRSERNLAFKCNWMDTDYESPCTERGRRFNIHEKGHVWCTQPENRCMQLEKGKIQDVGEDPCYESGIFHLWEFGAGVFHTGKRAGQGKKIEKVMIGKMALMTTRGPGDNEEDRIIFGFLRIKDFYTNPEDGATHVVGDKEKSLKIPKDSRLHFWDFYRNVNTPEKVWASGLHRYLNDNSVLEYLKAQFGELQKYGHEAELEIVMNSLSHYDKGNG